MDNKRFKEYQEEIARLRQLDTNITNRVRATYSIKQEQELEQQADLELMTKRREKKDQELQEFTKGLKVLEKLQKNSKYKGWINKITK